MTRVRHGGVKGVGRQRAGEEILIGAQVVPLGGGGAGQTQVLVVGTPATTADSGTRGHLLSSQLPDLKSEKVFSGALWTIE